MLWHLMLDQSLGEDCFDYCFTLNFQVLSFGCVLSILYFGYFCLAYSSIETVILLQVQFFMFMVVLLKWILIFGTYVYIFV